MKGPGLDVLEVAEGNVPGMAEAENLLTIGLTSTRPGCQSVKLITACSYLEKLAFFDEKSETKVIIEQYVLQGLAIKKHLTRLKVHWLHAFNHLTYL